MDIVIYSGFVPIVYHHQRDSIYQKGRKLYAAGHVHDLVEKCSQINGKVIRQTSVTAKPYSVELIFNTKREVLSAFCECIAGIAGYCKHISAVVIAINDEKGLSKTSYSCQWNKPSSSKIGQMKYAKGKKFEEIFELKKAYKKYDAVEPPFEQLRGINCMLSQMLLAEENLEANPKPSFDGVRTEELPDFSQLIERQRSSTLLAELNEVPFALYGDCCMQKYNTIIFTADVHKVCQNTFKDKVTWTKERKFRITASRCYGLYTFSKDWVLCNKAEKYFNVREFSNIYTQHGVKFEPVAREHYKRLQQCDVIECGLIVCETDCWLAASPDGIVLNEEGTPNKLLEIKCSLKGSIETIDQLLPLCDFLKMERGRFILKMNHMYYVQVQVGMALLNLQDCDFVIFASRDKSLHIIHVPFNADFCKQLLHKLKNVYFSNMLHTLCQKV